jgi:hypothetical protein
MDRQTLQLKVSVRGFTTVSNVFNQPYKSSLIGAFLCRDGLLPMIETFNFADIDCKFFPFALRMRAPFDVYECDDEEDESDQRWIMMKIQHSDLF